MKRCLYGVVLLIAAASASASDASAQVSSGHYHFPRRPAYRTGPLAPSRARRPHRYNPYDYYRDLYPRYYGGFHARFFSNYGVPSGDVGLRGNGIYWTPW